MGNTLYLVCGLSGNGKTTYAKKYKEDTLYVNPDDIYALYNGDECNHSHTFEVWQTLFNIVHIAEQDQRDVIIDTNALTVKQRSQFFEWFPYFNNYICISIEATKGQRRENNKKRKRVIPDFRMDEMEAMYEPPTLEEGWDEIYTFINDGNGDFYLKINNENQTDFDHFINNVLNKISENDEPSSPFCPFLSAYCDSEANYNNCNKCEFAILAYNLDKTISTMS